VLASLLGAPLAPPAPVVDASSPAHVDANVADPRIITAAKERIGRSLPILFNLWIFMDCASDFS
jgi:hypothetical protein